MLKRLADQIALACFAKLMVEIAEIRHCEDDGAIVRQIFRTTGPMLRAVLGDDEHYIY